MSFSQHKVYIILIPTKITNMHFDYSCSSEVQQKQIGSFLLNKEQEEQLDLVALPHHFFKVFFRYVFMHTLG